MTRPTTAIASFDVTVLDSAEPRRLADFYAAVLGWQVTGSTDEWLTVRPEGGGPGISFQLAPDHIPPTWPANHVPQQFHLDLKVADLDAAERQIVELGAQTTGLPAGENSFRVYRDPSGHPFCLCLNDA